MQGQPPIPILTTAQLDQAVASLRVQQLEFEVQQAQHLEELRARLPQQPAAKKPRPPDAPPPPHLKAETEQPRQPGARRTSTRPWSLQRCV